MCFDVVSKKIFRCGVKDGPQHTRTQFVKIEQCEAAKERGRDCDVKVRKEIGSTRSRDNCPDCNDEGYSRT